MAQFIVAIYHTNIKVAEFVTNDGRHLLRTGGTLPWRVNNCGDLSSPVNSRGEPNPKLTRGYLGFASVPNKAGTKTHHFFIFPDYETGRRELEASLKRKYAGKCIPDLVEKYAPSHENDSEKYVLRLLSSTGIERDQKIGDLSDEQFNNLANAIERLEGYHNDPDSRQEIWVPVSTIVATDGARPLADEEIILRVNGKDTAIKSNAVGQFPPIPHTKDAIQVLRSTPDKTLKEVGTIEGERGKSFSLLSQIQRFVGLSGPDKPPADANGQKHPFSYQVQPGDTLSSIAKRFRTSVEKIKTDNKRHGDKLFASEILGIYGPPPAGEKPTKAVPRVALTTNSSSTKQKVNPSQATGPVKTTTPARSDEGEGKPLALIPSDQRTAPWMVYAIAEAKRLKGLHEAEIEAKGTNYHKAINDGVSSMTGNSNAWCAAFVNWCLMQAGYPIENRGFYDYKTAKARAHSFFEVKGPKNNSSAQEIPMIRNPLFLQIDKPIYGAIGMVTSPNNHGSHVGFVYAMENHENIVLLGGNQSDRIKFSTFNKERTKPSITTVNGKKVARKGKPNKLLFFVPASYAAQAANAKEELPLMSTQELNEAFGISNGSPNEQDEKTT